MNFFGNKKISEEKNILLELCKTKEKEIIRLTESIQKMESENTILKEQISGLSVVNDELSTRNDHINNLYDKLKEKYKKLEDERDVVSVNELTFMNDNLRKERDELLVDKDKLINELAIYKSMFGHIQEIVKDYGNAILEVKKFNPDKIEDDEDDECLEKEDRLYRFKLTNDIEGEITPEQFSQLSEEQRNDWKNVSITLHDISDKVIEFNEFE